MWHVRAERGAGCFEFVRSVLAHQQAAADAADQDGEPIAAAVFADAVGGLARGHRRAGSKPVEIPAPQLRGNFIG